MFKKITPCCVTFLFTMLTFLPLSTAMAQRQQPLMELQEIPGFQDLGAIMQMHVTTGSSRSISMTVENGVKKIHAQEDGLKAYIEEQPDGAVLLKITRHYTSADLDELMDIEPELYMHLKSIPETTDTAEVEVSVGVTRKYEADSLEELQKEHPDVFEIYQRFTSGSNDDLNRLRDLPRLLAPEMMMPMPRGIQLEIPPDIRIFPPADEDKKSDKSSDDDKDT